MIIKVLLLCCFALLAVFGARLGESPRDMALKRLAVLGLFLLGSVAVLFPDLVTRAGQTIGVGRGTDLVLYLLVVVSVLVWLGTYKRLSRIDDQLTALARAQALFAAEQRDGDAISNRPE